MLGHSICFPNPAQAPAQGLSGATMSTRTLARRCRRLRGGAVVGAAFSAEPLARSLAQAGGEQPGSEGGRGQAAGMLRCQSRAGCRLSGGQQRTGIAQGVSSSVWLPLVFVGALSCLVPSLGCAGTGTSLSPVRRGTDIILVLCCQCFKDEPFQNAWGSQHHFLSRLLPPTWGSPPSPGVPCIPWKSGAASRIPST